MNKNENKFYKSLENIFLGVKVEGDSGYVNLLKIKEQYYKYVIDEFKDEVNKEEIIDDQYKEDFYNLLFSFFEKYFNESGSVYFFKTYSWQKIYERIYSSDKDVILFWKTHMLYYVKSDILFSKMDVSINDKNVTYRFVFDVTGLQQKQNNTKQNLIYELKSFEKNIVTLSVYNSSRNKTNNLEIISDQTGIYEEIIQKAVKTFESQNSVDYFLNKNAKAFLNEQLDLFISQILLEEKSEYNETRLKQLKIFKEYAQKLIAFISQFEGELVRIWNKPKFVLNSNYVITANKLNTDILKLIINDKGYNEQLNEWDKFQFISEGELKNLHDPNYLITTTLPIDTKYFKDIEIKIINVFPLIDKMLDGRLIKSDNYQMLNTYLAKFKNKVQCVYIDPPFDTGKDFAYMDNYQDSTWLTLMKDRLDLAFQFVKDNGCFWLHLDYNANVYGKELLKNQYDDITEIIYDTNATKDEEADVFGNKSMGNKNFQLKHQTLYYCRNKGDNLFNVLWKPNRKTTNLNIGWLDLIARPIVEKPHKITDYEYGIEKWEDNKLVFNKIDIGDEKIYPIGDIWSDIFSFTQSEMRVSESFSFTSSQKPENLMRRIIQSTTNQGDIVMDFFSGSGTTLAVAQKLNRRWIGVEMGEHFNEFYYDGETEKLGLLGRLKIVLNGDKKIKAFNRRPHLSTDINWNGGGIFKYSALEQYEDVLKNASYSPMNKQMDIKTIEKEKIFNKYVFFADKKLTDFVNYNKDDLQVDFSKLYKNIDMPESLSNLLGMELISYDENYVVLNDDGKVKKVKYNVDSMNNDEKIAFLNTILPYIWWGNKMKAYLEDYTSDINYSDLGNWCLPNLSNFSADKKLYDYQVNAVKNGIKVLNKYYTDNDWTKKYYNKLKESNIISNEYDLKEDNQDLKNNYQKNKKYRLMSQYYKVNDNKIIDGYQFFNRMCFWMATGSGKTIVIIKMIEALKYFQSQNLIPQNDILLLFPRQDLIEQFKKEVDNYNKDKKNKIKLANLKDFDSNNQLSFFNEKKIYYFRSDLLRDNKTENCVDFKDYFNNGNWYIFLDEAHRGDKETSTMQDYVSIMSMNGFLFNFSATFTEKIDFLTTCFNFNLEKFINAGYGKNIYLSKSYFDFNHKNLDYTSDEKTKQVLKSLIILCAVKKSRNKQFYSEPLLMTLVNSVNTKDSDLLLFFNKIEEIGSGTLNIQILDDAKNDLINELSENKSYIFGKDVLSFDLDLIRNISLEDILVNIFNSETNGKIQLIKGEKGKEYALQLETSSQPFALIKIGDADKFQREKLGSNYISINAFEKNKNFFKSLNEDNSSINILIGSRSFYEGWDSNRPNVINLINIGGKEAKKYVLQSIGRGIRVEPYSGYRKRLQYMDANKNNLLETLFCFSTDKMAIKSILEAIDSEKDNEYTVALSKNTPEFELLKPEYCDIKSELKSHPKFNISEQSLDKFKLYFTSHNKELFIIKYNISKDIYNRIYESLNKVNQYYQILEEYKYNNIEILCYRIIKFFNTKIKQVYKISTLNEEDILHYKNVKLLNMSENDVLDFKDKLDKVENFKGYDLNTLISKFQNKEISENDFKQSISASQELKFKDVVLVNEKRHYYSPILYSEVEEIDYIKHIIRNQSESIFVKNLLKFVDNQKFDFKWMFSKIEETTDNVFIPYFDGKSNNYKKFYPDFVFWLKKDDKYKIIFIDPKGTSYASYQNKIDGFNQLFCDEDDTPREFYFDDCKVSFELYMVADDINAIGNKYKKYWLNSNEFNWLNI